MVVTRTVASGALHSPPMVLNDHGSKTGSCGISPRAARNAREPRSIVRVSLVAFCLSVCLPIASAADIILAWDAPQDTNLAGYRVYYGTASRVYSSVVDAGRATTATVPGLSSGTWYFTVTAVNSAGFESDYSNEVSATVAPTGTTTCDLTGEGGINAADIQVLVNVILGLQPCPRSCDINKDGSVNALDLQHLSNIILGLGTCP